MSDLCTIRPPSPTTILWFVHYDHIVSARHRQKDKVLHYLYLGSNSNSLAEISNSYKTGNVVFHMLQAVHMGHKVLISCNYFPLESIKRGI